MNFFRKIIFLALVILADDLSALELRGVSKFQFANYQSQLRISEDSKNQELFQVNRLSVYHDFSERISFEASWQFIGLYSKIEAIELKRDYKNLKREYRALDFENQLFDLNGDFRLTHNLDRAYLTYSADNYSIQAGRQQVAFGSGKATNPTDVFTPYGPLAIDTEERSGVDALRFKMAIGEMGELDTGIIFGEDAERKNSAAWMLSRLVFGSFEIQPIYANFKKANLYGLDLLATAGGANFWIEQAYVKPDKEEAYTRITAGAEYQFIEDFFSFAEFHLSTAGKADPKDFPTLLDDFAYSGGGVFLLGRRYFDIGFSYLPHPLHTLGLGSKNNLDDGSSLVSASWDYNLSDDFYLNASFFHGYHLNLARDESPKTGLLAAIPDYEFTSYPTTLYLKAKYYF